jgi:hypothetical protein
MVRIGWTGAVLATAAAFIFAPAFAQVHDGPPPGGSGLHAGQVSGARASPQAGGHQAGDRRFEYRGQTFARLTPEFRTHWGEGEWRHAWHNGHYGWWWFLDGLWYFYEEPIYPYPTFIGPAYEEDLVAPPPPPVAAWYYCSDPAGYYPYVQACPTGWRTVPATPPAVPPGQ